MSLSYCNKLASTQKLKLLNIISRHCRGETWKHKTNYFLIPLNFKDKLHEPYQTFSILNNKGVTSNYTVYQVPWSIASNMRFVVKEGPTEKSAFKPCPATICDKQTKKTPLLLPKKMEKSQYYIFQWTPHVVKTERVTWLVPLYNKAPFIKVYKLFKIRLLIRL